MKLKKQRQLIKNGPTKIAVEVDFTVTAIKSPHCQGKHISRRGGVSSSALGNYNFTYEACASSDFR